MRSSSFRTWAAPFVILTIAWWADRSLSGQQPNAAAVTANRLAIIGIEPVNRAVPLSRAGAPIERLLEVTSGDELRLKLKPEAAGNHRYQIRFGAPSGARAATDPIAPAWVTVNGELLVRVPTLDASGWTARYAYVEQFEPLREPAEPREQRPNPPPEPPQGGEERGDAGQAPTPVTASSGNAYPLRIAPPANAIVREITPTVVQFESLIKVTGQGFFAPPEQIDLRIGEIRAVVWRVSPSGDWFSAWIPHLKADAPSDSEDTYAQTASGDGTVENESELFSSLSGNRFDAGLRNVSVTVWGVPAGREALEGQNPRNLPPLRLTLQRPPDNEYTDRIVCWCCGRGHLGRRLLDCPLALHQAQKTGPEIHPGAPLRARNANL